MHRGPAPIYSSEDIETLESDYVLIRCKYASLAGQFLNYEYKNAQAATYSKHGYLRRVNTLVRCIENVFTILPADSTGLPTSDQLSDVAINAQAFVFNVFGSLDNLAWIWVCESGLTKKDGKSIPNRFVGLGQSNTLIRESFSVELQKYLNELNPWFGYLEEFRHALAHRIPLYIPPFTIRTGDGAKYLELQTRMNVAISQRDHEEYKRSEQEQQSLASFLPWLTHEVEGQPRSVMIHPQLLTDFKTVAETGLRVICELSAIRS